MNEKKIIIVDDGDAQRKRLEIILRKEGFSVKAFNNGKDAFVYLCSNQDNLPSVVITDMNMPEMNGFELIEKITYKFGNEIAVIAFTAFANEYSIKEVFTRGAVDYIEKPGKKLEIITRVRQSIKALKNERLLKENEKRLRDILDSIHAGIVIIDAESHSIIDVNPMAEEIIGYSRDNIIGNICHKFICSAEKGKCPITDLNKSVDNSEKTLINRNGETVPILKTVTKTTLNGRLHLVESFLDISAIKKIQKELEILSVTDSLTGLYNRRYFFGLCNKEFNRSLRAENPFSLMMMDLDLFKKINDNYGHQIGDKALKFFADTAKSMLREYDTICRFGGEEFAVLCPETEIEDALLIAERIREKIEESLISAEEFSVNFTVSIGVAKLKNDDKSIDDIISRADKALYKAKYSGRNKVCSQ